MRIIILTLILLFTATDAFTQTRITRSFHNTPLSKALTEIDQSTHDCQIVFVYDELEDFIVEGTFKETPIAQAIQQLIGSYPIHVEAEGHKIFVECAQKEAYRLRGRIVNEAGVPLQNVNIVISRRDSIVNGGRSNTNGLFVIPHSTASATARISHVGYQTQTVALSADKVSTIRLREDIRPLSDVTVGKETEMDDRQKYHQEYVRNREKMWAIPLPGIKRTESPAIYSGYPVVILAELDSVRMGGITLSYVEKESIHLVRYKINNEEGRRIMSHFDYDKDKASYIKGNGKMLYSFPFEIKVFDQSSAFIGLRIVKPDGRIIEIDTEEYLSPLPGDDYHTRPDSIPLPDLEAGDIIDYYYYEVKGNTNASNAVMQHLFSFEGRFPIATYRMGCHIDRRFAGMYRIVGEERDIHITPDKKRNYDITYQTHYCPANEAAEVPGIAIQSLLSNHYYRPCKKAGLYKDPPLSNATDTKEYEALTKRSQLHGIVISQKEEHTTPFGWNDSYAIKQYPYFISTMTSDSIARLPVSDTEKARIIVAKAQSIIQQAGYDYRMQFIQLILNPLEKVRIGYDLILTTSKDSEPIDQLLSPFSIELAVRLHESGQMIYNDVDHPYDIPDKLRGRKAVLTDWKTFFRL